MNFKYVFKTLIKGCESEEERNQVREEYLCLAKISGSTKVDTEIFMETIEKELENERRR